VNDTIANSAGKDRIEMSEEVFGLMKRFKDFNYERIYRHPEVEPVQQKITRMLNILYVELHDTYVKSEHGRNTQYVGTLVREAPVMETFFNFIKYTNYEDGVESWRVVVDYIAGMTDHFAEKTFNQLFIPSPFV
jgi:dGTPase